MKVVDFPRARHPLERALQHLDVDVRGHGLHEHVHGLAHEVPRAEQDEDRNQHARQRVGGVPAGQQDDDRGPQRPDRPEQVGDHVQVGAPQVQAVIPMLAQAERDEGIDAEADAREGEHATPRDRRRVLEAPPRLGDDERDHQPEDDPVHQRRQDLGAIVAEGLALARGPAADPEREQRQRERGDVREHVRRVGDEGEAVRQIPAHELRHAEERAEDQPGADSTELAGGVPVLHAAPGQGRS